MAPGLQSASSQPTALTAEAFDFATKHYKRSRIWMSTWCCSFRPGPALRPPRSRLSVRLESSQTGTQAAGGGDVTRRMKLTIRWLKRRETWQGCSFGTSSTYVRSAQEGCICTVYIWQMVLSFPGKLEAQECGHPLTAGKYGRLHIFEAKNKCQYL